MNMGQLRGDLEARGWGVTAESDVDGVQTRKGVESVDDG